MPTDNALAAEVARLRREVDQIKKGQRVAHGASIENAALEVKDDTGSLRAIVGQQADGTSGIQVVNGPPPPAPSAPIVASVLGGVTVSWDGLFAAGAVIPLDWSRVEVHASATPGFDPLPVTLQTTIETAQGATVVVPTDVPVYVRLLARNTSGAASPSSAEVGPYGPAPVVASDILDGIVTEVKLANDAVTAAKIAAAAVGTTEIADDAITTPKIIAGAILAAQIAAGAVVTDKLAAEAVTAAKIAALAITSDKIDANAITTSKLAAGSVDATALKADAITGKTITGGTVTGATVQTATSGARVTLDTAMKVYNTAGDLLAQVVPDTSSLGYPNDSGFVAFNTVGIGRYWAMLSRGFIRFGREGSTYPWPPLIDHYIAGGTVSILELTSGTVGPTADLGQAYLTMVGSPDNGATPPKIQIHGDASGSRCDMTVNGMFTANSMVTGSMNITPSAANTPTSITVTGLNLPGTVHRAFVTAQSSVPGTVTEVTANNVTATGLTLWLSRTNTTTTNIWYLVVAS